MEDQNLISDPVADMSSQQDTDMLWLPSADISHALAQFSETLPCEPMVSTCADLQIHFEI